MIKKVHPPYNPTLTESNAMGSPNTYTKASWANYTSLALGKSYYTNLVKHLLLVQKDKCCYCGLKLKLTSDQKVEHIAPKAKHPEYSFYPTNLAIACDKCNSSGHKGSWDTIEVKASKYDDHTFSIVHPFFDDPMDHYNFVNSDSCILIQHKTVKGENTIKKLKLASIERSNERYDKWIIENLKLLPQFQALVEEALDYRKSKI